MNSINENEDYTLDDLSIIICIRYHESNKWVLERLGLLKEYYIALPKVYIVDFGSEDIYANQIKKVCEVCCFTYLYINDNKVFSLAIARNVGFSATNTKLLYFTDIDFFLCRDGFSKIIEKCNEIKFAKNDLDFMTLPAYHLSKYSTNEFLKSKNYLNYSCFLEYLAYKGSFSNFGCTFDFIVPYSNNILISRDLFDLAGGYCSYFRGHGSEDFEFLARLHFILEKVNTAKNFFIDSYKPKSTSFFDLKKYKGFRRVFELYSFPSELLGFRTFHLWHPMKKDLTGWKENNDRKRLKFSRIVGNYKDNPINILECDYLNRSQSAFCILNNSDGWKSFLLLRLKGYSIKFYFLDDFIKKITNGEVNERNEISIFYLDLEEKKIDFLRKLLIEEDFHNIFIAKVDINFSKNNSDEYFYAISRLNVFDYRESRLDLLEFLWGLKKNILFWFLKMEKKLYKGFFK